MGVSITLKELANISGFSTSTISKALNDKIDISLKTKATIIELAKEFNYVPNSFASGLRNQKSHSIAVIVPQINIEFYSCLLFYFQKIAQSHGYKIFLFQSFESDRNEVEILNSINDGSADGAVIFSTDLNRHNYSETYSIPVVAFPITNTEDKVNLKQNCISSFAELLEKID